MEDHDQKGIFAVTNKTHQLKFRFHAHTRYRSDETRKGKLFYFDIILLPTLRQPHHTDKQENGKIKVKTEKA